MALAFGRRHQVSPNTFKPGTFREFHYRQLRIKFKVGVLRQLLDSHTQEGSHSFLIS